MNTLADIENEIAAIYRWFAKQAPGVVVQEAGTLADLWAIFDAEVEQSDG